MLVRPAYRSRFSEFGFFFSDDTPAARTSWCDRAADIWPGADKEELRAKCKSVGKFQLFAPWNDFGKKDRGLPMNFSTDPNQVAAGRTSSVLDILPSPAAVAAGAATAAAQTFTTTIAPTTQPNQPAAVPGQAVVRDVGLRLPDVQLPKSGGALVPILAVAGLGAVAFILTRRKSGGAMAGYSRRRRRARRSRR